jgi:hypothetical protein
VADDLTTVTELATALGMLGCPSVDVALACRPPALVNLTSLDWDRLDRLRASGSHDAAFGAGYDNGAAFLAASDALRGRIPTLIEWKGSHKAPGDDAVPADLRVDHVYLVSCKYLSRNLHNRSPSRVFDRLLGPGDTDPTDWYLRTAPRPYQALYEAAAAFSEAEGLPDRVEQLAPADRLALRAALRARAWPTVALAPYAELCQEVSARTAERWSERITSPAAAEALVWRLLRILSAPYFILGSDARQPLRLRIDTPWDWRQRYRLRRLALAPALAGQPQVTWTAECTERATGHTRTVAGHVEIRWSHGRFAQTPEAKVYLDTPHHDVPGYVRL